MSKIFILIFSIFLILINQILILSANDDTYINSNNITYNEKEDIVELAENSKINYKNTNILINKGIIDYKNNEFEVFGNFYLYEELTILSGKNLKGNTSLDVFSANNVSYIYNDDLKIDSDSIDRNKNLVYFFNNFLTPCELEGYFSCPTWSLRIDKTEYSIEEDKFTHFDTFLQIADYKVFYLPYFSHYGAKAPRKKGFLTPSIEITVGGDQGIVLPYYLPISQNTDILFKPKITMNQNFEFMEKYQLNTLIEKKSSGGNTSIKIDNIKNTNDDINTSLKFETKQVTNKNNIFSASALFTNSISTTRSINEEPLKFEDIYLRLENYNFFTKDDYLKSELSSVESFDSTDLNSIPVSPNLNYLNSIKFNDNSLINDLNFTILKRNKSTISNPSDSFRIDFDNELINSFNRMNLTINNKLLLNNSYIDNYFKDNKDLNHNNFKSFLSLSSDIYFNYSNNFLPRIKLIAPMQIENSNKTVNEDSGSITFNYQNQFSENRFFGNDLFDSSPRIVYGLENFLLLNGQKINLNINQSYENNSNNTYLNKINQTSKFSDYAIEAEIINKDILFRIDSRVDQNKLSNKEMNYSLTIDKPLNISLNYNETKSEAFKDLSNDTQSVKLEIMKKVNDNINIGYKSNLDIKNNYDPYQSSLMISLFDECSQLDVTYSNTRFNDNFNTKPKETISLTFTMEYLGFFGYEQSTDLFFSEPGNVNYGL